MLVTCFSATWSQFQYITRARNKLDKTLLATTRTIATSFEVVASTNKNNNNNRASNFCFLAKNLSHSNFVFLFLLIREPSSSNWPQFPKNSQLAQDTQNWSTRVSFLQFLLSSTDMIIMMIVIITTTTQLSEPTKRLT